MEKGRGRCQLDKRAQCDERIPSMRCVEALTHDSGWAPQASIAISNEIDISRRLRIYCNMAQYGKKAEVLLREVILNTNDSLSPYNVRAMNIQ